MHIGCLSICIHAAIVVARHKTVSRGDLSHSLVRSSDGADQLQLLLLSTLLSESSTLMALTQHHQV